jgi:hypothetical protein
MRAGRVGSMREVSRVWIKELLSFPKFSVS